MNLKSRCKKNRTYKVKILLFSMVVILIGSFCFSGCGGKAGVSRSGALAGVRTFAYQLNNLSDSESIRLLADSQYDLLVIDRERSLKGREDYNNRKDVLTLKESKGRSRRPKVVICYLDVGEAEEYRWYWEDDWRVGDPDWIVAEDPDGWNGNYPVRFWRAQWLEIMKSAIEDIIADGFDGIYLDWLEVYSFDPVMDAAEEEGLDPSKEIVDFVSELAGYARAKKPGFIIIAQNASELCGEPGYPGLFDGIAQEAIWFDGGGDPDSGGTSGGMRVDQELTREYLDNLGEWEDLGIPVFDIEYTGDPREAGEAYELGEEKGFRTYVTLRPLDALTATPPP